MVKILAPMVHPSPQTNPINPLSPPPKRKKPFNRGSAPLSFTPLCKSDKMH